MEVAFYKIAFFMIIGLALLGLLFMGTLAVAFWLKIAWIWLRRRVRRAKEGDAHKVAA